MKSLLKWIAKFASIGSTKPEGERRFRCRKCSEIGFFYAKPTEWTIFEPTCGKCGQKNRIFVPGPKAKEMP